MANAVRRGDGIGLAIKTQVSMRQAWSGNAGQSMTIPSYIHPCSSHVQGQLHGTMKDYLSSQNRMMAHSMDLFGADNSRNTTV